MTLKLINCPACESQVSSQAAACPRCGHPISQIKPFLPEASSSVIAPSRIFASDSLDWSTDPKLSEATYRISNISLSQEAILQRLRQVFEANGFTAKQSKYTDGTAYSVGSLMGAEHGGLVGGITSINKKTWNPFLVSKTGYHPMQAKIAVLSLGQKSRMVQNDLFQTENDIELQIKIEAKGIPGWLLFTGGLIGMIAAFFCVGATCLNGFFGAFIGLIAALFLGGMAMEFSANDVKKFQKLLTDTIQIISPKLKS